MAVSETLNGMTPVDSELTKVVLGFRRELGSMCKAMDVCSPHLLDLSFGDSRDLGKPVVIVETTRNEQGVIEVCEMIGEEGEEPGIMRITRYPDPTAELAVETRSGNTIEVAVVEEGVRHVIGRPSDPNRGDVVTGHSSVVDQPIQ